MDSGVGRRSIGERKMAKNRMVIERGIAYSMRTSGIALSGSQR